MKSSQTVRDVGTKVAVAILSVNVLLLGTQLPVSIVALSPPPPGNSHVSPAPDHLDTSTGTATNLSSSSVCPRAWRRATLSGLEFSVSGRSAASDRPSNGGASSSLCVWVNERPRAWRDALAACRRRNGFLVKLETLLELEGGQGLFDNIRHRGLETVWTGMHHRRGVLLWDELRPQIVTPYYGSTQRYGWQRRRWDFDHPSFLRGKRTCGVLRVGDGEDDDDGIDGPPKDPFEENSSKEVVAHEAQVQTGTAKNPQEYIDRLIPKSSSHPVPEVRRRRSLMQAPGDPFVPLPTGEVTRVPSGFKLDLEDAGTKQTPTQEAKIENFQQFLSNQGFQEKYVESIGESPPTNDPQPNTGTEDNVQPDALQLQATTASTTSTTDQSNLEDDDYYAVTKRTETTLVTPQPPQFPVETVWSAGVNPAATVAPLTFAPRFSQQNSVKGTSLPASTYSHGTATSAPPTASTTNVDDILNRLLQAALMEARANRQSAPPHQLDTPPETSDFHKFAASLVNLQKSSESLLKHSDSNEYLRYLLEKSSVTYAPPHVSSVPTTRANAITVNQKTKLMSNDNMLRGFPNIPTDNNAKDSETKEADKYKHPSNGYPQDYGRQLALRSTTTAIPPDNQNQILPKEAATVLPKNAETSQTEDTGQSDLSKSVADFLESETKKSEEDNDSSSSPNPLSRESESTTSATSTVDLFDDSQEVTDTFSSMESTTKPPQTNKTERQSKEYSSREMSDFYGIENKTNSVFDDSEFTRHSKSNPELPLDTLSGADSAEVFDTQSNFTDSFEILSTEGNDTKSAPLARLTLVSESHSDSTSSADFLSNSVAEDLDTKSVEDTKDLTSDLLEELRSSSSSLSQPDNQIELEDCDEEHPSVCVTEAIEELTLVGHCERGWYGHRLLDRCYKPIGYRLTEFEARQKCLQHGAVLAMADTEFYGNVTALLLLYFSEERQFDPTIWVDAGLNMAVRVDGSCFTLQGQSLDRESCDRRRSFFCQKDAHFHGFHPGAILDRVEPDTYVHNMTSFHPQTLYCPLRRFAADDVVVWFKDGKPVRDPEDEEEGRESNSFGFNNGQLSNSLALDLSILRRVGQGGDRIPKPAMLQGTYWCETWRRTPMLHRVASHKIFLRFTDVITLHGYIITEPTSYLPAAMFNRMGLMTGLPVAMERRLATMNKNITHHLRGLSPVVRDVITFIKRLRASNGKSVFVTYICLATGDLSPDMRADITDQYLSSFHYMLEQQETEVRQEWGVTLPLDEAVVVSMTDMCPETDLTDKRTGLSANFASTPVNTRALSTDFCNGIYSGSAWCRGDLQTGAFWDNIRITGSCDDWDWRQSSDESDDSDSRWDSGKKSSKVDDVIDVGDGFVLHKLPNSALLELDEIEIEEENVADVTERLTNVLEDSDELSESDVSAVAQVVDRIVAVNRPPTEVSDKLVRTVSKVMDASPEVLQKAEQESQALSRLVSDMEKFGEKVDMGSDPVVRHVTPNVAMELWSLDDAGEDLVIGMGATGTSSWAAPLSDPKIVTIKSREWAEQNLPNFDIAIELPESLVRNTIRYSSSALRLSMFIYRKSSLFMENGHGKNEPGEAVGPMTPPGQVNSAVISASLGGRRVQGLEDKVRLIFRPLKIPEEDGGWDNHCVFWDDGTYRTNQNRGQQDKQRSHWSREGCVYNGTWNGRHVCLCDHLTNFAVLLDFYGEQRAIPTVHNTSLSVITLVGLSLSIFGLAITIITFIAFKKLRQGRAQQTLFNMAIALLCFQTVFLFGVKQTAVWPVCLLVAVLLHYFILVSFAWMLIEAVLQYLTFVKVLGTYIARYTLKTALPAWGIPLLPVATVLVTDYNLYLGRADYCWMDLQAFYYAFALPVGVIIVFNLIMFLVIITSLVTRPKGLRSNQASSKARETNLKAAFTIFMLLGLTWMFGYLAIEDARIPFQYAFTVLSSLQGFLIFVLMVVRRRQVRDQWRQMCCVAADHQPRRQKKLSPASSSSSTSNNSVSNSRTLPSFINHTYNGGDLSIAPPPFPLPPPVLRREASIHV